MTVRETLIEMLMRNGMFEQQAKEVVRLSIVEINQKDDYQITFDRPAYEYPNVLVTLIYNSAVKPQALKWINENKPEAWFKPMFENH